jgi:uncharacterized repeat protein (TIGR01451 family)
VGIEGLTVDDTLVPFINMTLVESGNSDKILEAGETWTLTYTYTVTVDDVAAGSVTNVVSVTDPDDPNNPVEDTTTTPKPGFTVVKEVTEDRFNKEGDELHYTVTIKNTGEVGIEGLTVDDTLVPFINMTLVESGNSDKILEAGETWTLTYTYTVTVDDVAAGSVTNVVSVTDPDDPNNPVEDTTTTPIVKVTDPGGPEIKVPKEKDPVKPLPTPRTGESGRSCDYLAWMLLALAAALAAGRRKIVKKR